MKVSTLFRALVAPLKAATCRVPPSDAQPVLLRMGNFPAHSAPAKAPALATVGSRGMLLGGSLVGLHNTLDPRPGVSPAMPAGPALRSGPAAGPVAMAWRDDLSDDGWGSDFDHDEPLTEAEMREEEARSARWDREQAAHHGPIRMQAGRLPPVLPPPPLPPRAPGLGTDTARPSSSPMAASAPMATFAPRPRRPFDQVIRLSPPQTFRLQAGTPYAPLLSPARRGPHAAPGIAPRQREMHPLALQTAPRPHPIRPASREAHPMSLDAALVLRAARHSSGSESDA